MIVTTMGAEQALAFFPSPWLLADGPYAPAQLSEDVAVYAGAKAHATSGSKQAIAQRKALRFALSNKLRALGTYLMLQAHGDLAKLEATGYAINHAGPGAWSNIASARAS